MTNFRGLCIGGPLAGQMKTHNGGSRFRVSVLKPESLDLLYGQPMTECGPTDAFEYVTYQHVAGVRANRDDRKLDFFVAEGGSTDIMDIIETIANGYAGYQDLTHQA